MFYPPATSKLNNAIMIFWKTMNHENNYTNECHFNSLNNNNGGRLNSPNKSLFN